MKRFGQLYPQIYSIENLILAEQKSQKGKTKQIGVKTHNLKKQENLEMLHDMLKNKKYKTSTYQTFLIYEPKERVIFKLPYFPDRICHHAIMNVLEPIFLSIFTNDTYSCIKGKGIHCASYRLRKALKDKYSTKYCLKLDIKKFYPSVDHNILKSLLRAKFKDDDLLKLLDEIIESTDGLPIGNYLSQYFANFYLTKFDNWLKSIKKVKFYFRYADDMIILSESKSTLHILLHEIKEYLNKELNLTVKENYQIFPVKSRGIDFVGYVHYHTHTLLRKQIKKNFTRKFKKNPNSKSIPSYMGWAKHCNSKNLITKMNQNARI